MTGEYLTVYSSRSRRTEIEAKGFVHLDQKTLIFFFPE